jgi:hypothetical protein
VPRHPYVTDAEYVERIKARTKVSESGCWEWQGFVYWTGYATMSYRGKPWPVHRLMHTLVNGPVPKGKDCCHTCDNRRCCNPDHLWIGSRQENLQDAARKGRAPGQDRTHCPRGHEYTVENTARSGKTKWRDCRICARARMRIKAGWPEDLAYSAPPTPKGYRPVNGNFSRRAKAM